MSQSQHLIKDFTKLTLWQKANEVEQQIFNITKRFPKVEQYRLVDQLVRCSRGVSANISEGVCVITKGRAIYHLDLQVVQMSRPVTI
ncbi:CHP02436-containing protein [Pseudobacteroides cellulosolvens ATCC 35603 = DSM 2933]|uniref:CHP02436-containing protein n=1 Tax=Pseudobacteroides cellulosolvens ATCC 35603 = DSM 2933 TaxID=398512 RepID=A0A0L6JNG4_9FIRM|nr:four helix bundle protein [Pseudobacteroides cellulosolvens]KNY27361.1 CHP02436-containing protein [Pseudobacteroides cellulosolvens ATCC 35603 = DSM 2933]